MTDPTIDPIRLLRPRRQIEGISAILLPFGVDGSVDWPGFRAHVARTAAAGLIPAVNMDTGYINLIDAETRDRVLSETRAVVSGGSFVAGAFVADHPASAFDRDAYLDRVGVIEANGGTPVVFQSFGLCKLAEDDRFDAYLAIARDCDRFIAFELSPIFAPFGSIDSLDFYRRLLSIPACVGAKHSSLRRQDEWLRLRIRDEVRPDFRVYTGNDLAIDMVMYGSDYLLGLSTFAPDHFARRDAFWAAGDPAFHELNDRLQYLGFFAFREPVPAYKHSAAMFLAIRGWIDHDATHPRSPNRPESDREILRRIAESLR